MSKYIINQDVACRKEVQFLLYKKLIKLSQKRNNIIHYLVLKK